MPVCLHLPSFVGANLWVSELEKTDFLQSRAARLGIFSVVKTRYILEYKLLIYQMSSVSDGRSGVGRGDCERKQSLERATACPLKNQCALVHWFQQNKCKLSG